MDRPLKILHLFDFYLPSTMNWAYQMLRHTPDVQVWCAAPWMVQNTYFDPDFRFFVRDFQAKFAALPKDEWHLEWLSTNLIRLEKYWPRYKNWLFQQLRNDPPDVLHAHFAPVGCHYLDLAQRLDIPLVVSFYGYDFSKLPFEKPVYHQRYQQLFHQATAITTTGIFTPKLLEVQGCPMEKVTPVPLSIVTRDFPFQVRNKVSGQLSMVQIATITPKKGHLATLEALRLALLKCPNLKLTLAGEQQDKALVRKMKQFIKTNQLEKQVNWLDFLPHESVPDFLGSFDLFIHPSTRSAAQDCEGAPVVILEAQCTGLPVLATTHADIPAEVLHGSTGLLCAENDPATLAQNIERFYCMENSEYQLFSHAAHQHIKEYFDIKTMGEKLKKVYQNIKECHIKK